MNSISEIYFRPKKFEYFGEKTIYDLIGIKFFKKYLPTTGDLARLRRGIKQIDIGSTNRNEELCRYERQTRNYEWRHIIGAFLFISFWFLFDSHLRFSIVDVALFPALNMYLNIYPIFLQRYNRIRIIKILRNNAHLSPYDYIDYNVNK